MFKRETVEIDRLLRKSTFEKHVTIDALKSSDKNYNVEVIKFCPSFEGFSPPASPVIHHPRPGADASIEALDFKPGEGNQLPLPPGTPPRSKINPHDIILNVPRAELVEIKPCDSGWFAIFTIDRLTKDAIDAFVAAGRRHFKENRFQVLKEMGVPLLILNLISEMFQGGAHPPTELFAAEFFAGVGNIKRGFEVL